MTPRTNTRLILSGGFVAMILLTIALGIGAIRINNNLIELNRSLFDHPFIVSNTLRDIKADILEIHRIMKDIVQMWRPHDMDEAAERIDEIEAQAFERFDIVSERYLGDKADVESARRTFSEWRAIRSEAIGLVRDGQHRAASAITTGKGPAHMVQLNSRLDVLIAFAHNKAAEFRAESNVQFDQKQIIMLGLIAVVVISGGLIATFVFFWVARTEKDLAEREELLRQSQKMEAVGQLTGGLAHDLNNVLSIISLNVGMLKKKVANVPQAPKHADLLEQSVTRAADLTRKLLDYSRTGAREVTRVSVNGFIQGLESLIKKSLTPAIDLRVVLSEDAWAVDIDQGDFETSLLNLALNARDAMPEGGSLVIETVNKNIDRHYADRNPGSSAGDFVLISVSDTGTGMKAETVAKAFEPFFTTKDVGQGTGLGLSMVYGFVQRSGGHVKIYSEPGEGTTIHLYLPRARGRAERKDTRHLDPETLPDGDETILVVDDEDDLVSAAVSFLGSLGYRTVTAGGGRQALEALQRDTSIDLLFSDVVMPGGMDGYQLAIEAMKLRPDLRVLLTSGFTPKREELANGTRRLASDLSKSLLHKPYNMAELAIAVRQTIDGNRRAAGH